VIIKIWPIRIYISFPNKTSEAADYTGRRYGDYFWLSITMLTRKKNYKINLSPRHLPWFDSWISYEYYCKTNNNVYNK